MQRMTDGLTGGLQRIKGAGGMFHKTHDDTDTKTERSGRSSIWGFGSRATSKANSKAASTAASRATSAGISNATSMVISEVGTVDSAM
jgi:hypothetical protein